jgi:hypothetical protein
MAAISHSKYVSQFPLNLPRSTATAARLAQLENILTEEFPKGRRANAIEGHLCKVQSIQKECLASPTQETLEDAFDRLEWGVADLYKVREQKSTEKVIACVNLLLKDAHSLVVSPVKKSSLGEEGPTLLINYPRNDKTKAYVVKWTNKNELCSHRVYEQMSTFFNHPEDGVGFLTTRGTIFDFAKGVQELSDRNLHQLSAEETRCLQKNFKDLLSSAAPEKKPKDREIFVSDFIFGENLFDFAYTKYPLLTSEQKVTLFTRLARLALLDLLVGNLDRLIRVEQNKGQYSLDAVEANLGNVMLVWRQEMEEPPRIYAIDNTMNAKLLSDPAEKVLYNEFLTRLCSDTLMVELLANNMLDCILGALVTQVDDSGKNVREVREKLKVFQEDLRSIGRSAFVSGLHQMTAYLKTRLIPEWNQEEGASLRAYLEAIAPEFLISLQERLDIFHSSEKVDICQ